MPQTGIKHAMLVLLETAAGFAIFKVLDENKLASSENILSEFDSPDKAQKILELKHFHKFGDTTEALDAVSALLEGKIGTVLKKFLKKHVVKSIHEDLAVADAKLGNLIKEKFELNCVHNSKILDLMKGIRTQINTLLPVLPEEELSNMSLGLAHSLSRYKLKFSPDKVDTMIIQTISLLDDLDKELNNYVMRCREWYGWHFPELGKIVADHVTYAKIVKSLGMRTNAPSTDLSSLVSEDVEEQIRNAAQISMGTEISDEDISNIIFMCGQILEMVDYRAQLFEYLRNRVMAIAPNLAVLVGELVAARLIAHAGSLINLAKCPASTVQILGSEKAMFRALKTKHNTPKYGLLFHATLVGQATQKNKGRISRMLATKAAIATRFDALGDGTSTTTGPMDLGLEHKAKLEIRLRYLEQNQNKKMSGTKKPTFAPRYEDTEDQNKVPYDTRLDSTLPTGAVKRKALNLTLENENETNIVKKLKMSDESVVNVMETSSVSISTNSTEITEGKIKKKKKKVKTSEE